MIKIICLLSFASFLHAFLLDTDTPGTSGGLMTDNHYDFLLKLFMDERNARLKLQQYVVKKRGKITALSGLKARLKKLENKTSMNTQTYTTSDLHDKYSRLEEKYIKMQKTQIKLSDELQASRNRTLELEREVTDLKQVGAINQLQALNNTQQQLQSLQQDVNSLKSNSQARGQDLVAMYNDVTDNKKKLSTLEVKQQLQLVNISSLENNQSAIVNDLSSIGTHHDEFVVNITQETKELQSKHQTLESEIQKTKQQLTTDNKYVGFTAFGRGYGTKTSRTILTFPDIKSSFGISHLTTVQNDGKFSCEKSGLYFVSITVMSCKPADSEFYIYKGNTLVSSNYIGRASANDCNTGTGTILLNLNVSETVYVKTARSLMQVFDMFSSFTVLKIK